MNIYIYEENIQFEWFYLFVPAAMKWFLNIKYANQIHLHRMRIRLNYEIAISE